MISAQLNKYKRSSNNTNRKTPNFLEPSSTQSPVHSRFSYNPSISNPSYQESPNRSTSKSKLAQLNQKLLQEAKLYEQRRVKSLRSSHTKQIYNHRHKQTEMPRSRQRIRSSQRSNRPFNPLDPVLIQFASQEEKIRKRNSLAKHQMTSTLNPFAKSKMKSSLPPKSPFVVSEYLQSSARSVDKEGPKSTAHSYSKRGLEQIVFVTDQSDNDLDINSSDQYKSVKNGESNFQKTGQFLNSHMKSSKRSQYNQEVQKKNTRDLDLNEGKLNQFSATRKGSGFRTPSFNEETEPIFSPLQIQQKIVAISAPYFPSSYDNLNLGFNEDKLRDHSQKAIQKLADKRPIYLSVFIIAIIGLFLVYEIIK